jgi:enoyl-CoA hydratase/carnithine racemase
MAYDDFKTLRVQLTDGVARVLLDNGPINLLDKPLFKELLRLVDQLAIDDQVRVVVLASANPDYFIAHFDVGLILRFPADPPGAPDPEAPLSNFHRLCETLRTMPKATVTVIEGRAGGGGSELALSCDMRFALRGKAVFNQPEVALGILPGGSGTVRLGRLLGRGRALEAVLGCDDIPADLAEAWGWVNRTLPADALWPHVNRLAARIASFPPHAVAAAKASVLQAESGVLDHLRAEAQAFQGTLSGPGTRDAMERFLDLGGQTVDGEARLAALAAELHQTTPPATPRSAEQPAQHAAHPSTQHPAQPRTGDGVPPRTT